MKITTPANPPYTGELIGHAFLKAVITKVYFANICGRERVKYEWEQSGLDRDRLLEGLDLEIGRIGPRNVPHIAVAFPHTTTVYRWGDPRNPRERETNIYLVGRGNTPELERIVIAEPAPPIEVGCNAEIHTIEEERALWMAARTVEKYLSCFAQTGIDTPRLPVTDPNKLRAFLEAA